MTLAGLGKLSPNMVLMGFKNNWKQDLVGLHQYMDIMYSAFDLRLSFAILRCKEGLDFSSQVRRDQSRERKLSQRYNFQIASEQQIVREVAIKKGEEHDSDDEVRILIFTFTPYSPLNNCSFPFLLQSPKGLAPAPEKKTRKISTAVYR